MAGSFSVGALAVAAPNTDAVGAVRLTLLPRRLEIELLRAAGYKESFAPAALTSLVRMSVPYTAVRGLVRRDEGLALSLDPAVAAPYARFVLAHFTDLPLEALAAAHKRRGRVRALALVVPAVAAALVALWVPERHAAGMLGRGALALLVFGALTLALARLGRVTSVGGPWSERLREAFERRLAQRMGLEPRDVFDTDPFELPEPLPPRVARGGASPATRGRLVAAGLALASVLGILLGARALSSLPERPAVAVGAASGVAPEVNAGRARVPDAAALPPCRCVRADSPLWRGGMPALSVIPIAQDGSGGVIAPVKDDEGIPRYDFDVAVVNNAGVALRDVRVLLTFARRNAAGERVGVTDRGLFWEGELGPARSVKWGVRAPGSEVRIDLDEARTLEEVPPAPADGFARLLSARQPLVRLHASMMLAWLGDPRAADAARELTGLGPDEEAVRARVLRAAAPLVVCDVSYEASRLRACVMNRAEEAATRLGLREVAPGAARSAALVANVPPGEGRVVEVEGFGPPAEELEAFERRAAD